MNKFFSLAPACLLAWSACACAAPQAVVPVSLLQMQVIGITAQTLRHDAAPVVAAMPARVVLPPGRERVVSAPLAGVVVQVLVQPNQSIARGAPLLRIASSELATLQLNLAQAASRAKLARQAAQRERALFSEGIVAQRRVQEAEAALAEANAALAQSRAALRLAGMGGADVESVSAGGGLHETLTVSAVASGIVTGVDVRPGQRVEPAAALVRVAQLGQLLLEIDVPAAQAERWPVGTHLAVQGSSATAIVTGASPLVAADSQTSTIRAVLANAPGLHPGQLVTVTAPLDGSADAWDVPLAALAHVGKQAYVFVQTRDGFEARAVTETGGAGQRVRVQGPLKAGEAIAVTGVVALKAAWQGEQGGQ